MDLQRPREALDALFEQALALAKDQITPPFFSLTSPLYWPHLASALALSVLVVVVGRARGRPYTATLLRASARAYLHPSARVDYAFYFVNGVVYPLLFVPWLLDDGALRRAVTGEVTELLGPRPAGETTAPLTLLALSAAIFLAYDFGRFAGHYLQHKVPVLWQFHKVHHSARALNPMTTFRLHPVDLAVMATFTSLSVAAVAGLLLYLFPGDEPLWGELSLRVALALFVFDLTGSTLRHTSVWLSYGPLLGRLLISPAQHQIHHSADPRHFGKNMGFVLAIWDWMAGTLHLTGAREELTYGAGEGDDDAYRGVLRLYGIPLLRLLQPIEQRIERARRRRGLRFAPPSGEAPRPTGTSQRATTGRSGPHPSTEEHMESSSGRFVWYELMTTDPKAAVAFYSGLIGWTTQTFGDATPPGEPPYLMWVGGQGPVGGVTELPEQARKMGAPPHWMSNITVADVDAAVKKVTDAGGTVFMPATDMPTIGRVAIVGDPQGAVIGLFKPDSAMPPHDTTKQGEFAWSELMTTDHEAAFSLYSSLFGWERTGEMDMGPAGKYLLVGQAGKSVGGMFTKGPEMPGPAAWLYYIRVDDLDACIEKAKSTGAKLLNGPMDVPGGDRIAQLLDPQGAAFALVSAIKPAA